MDFQAHRGVSTEAPENTIPAIKLAIAQGYKYIEMDVSDTKDGKLVLMHDGTINRTGRYIDGRKIERRTFTSSITYSELCTYDFGIGFSKKYNGTRAPLFEDVLKLCKAAGVIAKIDSKYTRMKKSIQIKLFKLLHSYQDNAMLTCFLPSQIRLAKSYLPGIGFSFEGKLTDASIAEVASLVPKERLFMWVPYQNSHTSWVRVDFINRELAEKVKKVARLGVWILSTENELQDAIAFGADAIETAGQLKPDLNSGIVADMHSHSSHSHDAFKPMKAMRDMATEKGLAYLAVTDHCDVFATKSQDIFTPLVDSFLEATSINYSRLEGQTKLLKGVEIGEGFWFPEDSLKVQKLLPYDVIIGSVHGVKRENVEDCSYALIDFSEKSDEYIQGLLGDYFRDMKKLVATTDFDILAHITCPLRYIAGKYKRRVDLAPYMGEIEYLLDFIISHGIALEVNTSSFDALNDFMPSREIIKKYKEKGGYLITLGGDAHVEQNVAKCFEEALSFLKELGFKNIYYFENRMPIQCKI